MKIKWYAHAAFLITSNAGTRIIIDPYTSEPNLCHGAISETADIVTISHTHGDHNNVASVRGNPQVVRTPEDVAKVRAKDVKIRAVAVAHDDSGGSQRGKNTIFCFEVDGVDICHCGDLGHVLTETQVKTIGKVDVLMVPVGGFFTIAAAAAAKVVNQLKPRIVLPMHYKTDKIGFPIAPVDDFLKGKGNVTRQNASELEVEAGKLPASMQIIVLKPAL